MELPEQATRRFGSRLYKFKLLEKNGKIGILQTSLKELISARLLLTQMRVGGVLLLQMLINWHPQESLLETRILLSVGEVLAPESRYTSCRSNS